ncbi:hypothetical protein OESDEN_21893 [Oesophagostomum dentatum]|uniref:Ankyrin repeat protein n=1 Tax=Oesophagostomum dentatum TaxID=61180 RepID=A0A0B1S3L9_OESDE|nr:hypothetical protein OESDEN_21893 [Oesophagostomum dentatum]
MVFFEVDITGCRLLRRRNQAKPQCFTDLRPAATYLTLELARAHSFASEMLPIRDITWRKIQKETLPESLSPLYLAIICRSCVCSSLHHLYGCDCRDCLENSLYRPPTPPDMNSPEYDSNDDDDKKDNGTHLESVVDGDSPLLLAVRRGDYEEVERMISSTEDFIDVVRPLFRWELHIPLIIFCLFYVDSNGLGSLHHAVANNDAKMLKMLIECGQVDVS